MSITLQKNKLTAFISKGTTEDIQIYSEAIERAIDFYLCREDFQPILQCQAEAIYFLKWMKKSLVFDQDSTNEHLGSVLIEIPKNDPNLIEGFQDALDKVLQEFFVHGSENGLDPHLSDAGFFLFTLRKSLSPTLSDVLQNFGTPLMN